MKKRNPLAKAIKQSRYRPRIVRAKKGKGSYKRKERNRPPRGLFHCPVVGPWRWLFFMAWTFCRANGPR